MQTEIEPYTMSVLAADRLQTVNYVVVASFTIVVFDYCLTLSSEVDLIWYSKLNLVKVLFFLSRYPVFADTLLSLYTGVMPIAYRADCWLIHAAVIWSSVFGIGIAEIILVLRTTALWGQSRKVLWNLSLLLSGMVILVAVFTYIGFRTLRTVPPPFPSLVGCSFVDGGPLVVYDFVFVMIFETVIVVLTTYRWYRKFRGSATPLVTTLYRDGSIFFVCLFLISFLNVLVMTWGPLEYHGLIITFQRVMHSILSCRILLNMRHTARTTSVSRPLLQHCDLTESQPLRCVF